MTETEYVNCCDVQTVCHIEKLLWDITPENSTIIDKDEYELVKKTIKSWRIQLYDLINKSIHNDV
jgi:phage pi2 protein 07